MDGARRPSGAKCGAGRLGLAGRRRARSVPSRSSSEAAAGAGQAVAAPRRRTRDGPSVRPPARRARVQSMYRNSLLLKIARASVAAPNSRDHAIGPIALLAVRRPAEGQPVGPLDLPAGIVARPRGAAGRRSVGQVEHQGVVQQRQGLQRGRRDGAARGGGRGVGAVEGVEEARSGRRGPRCGRASGGRGRGRRVDGA